ncbi:MAG TPA: PAS domain S-box protein [Thermodesulfovibrionales bacterium]|nr:PAS domain S-box protein [Thermodesulfovibrionales bacterium]
MDLQGNREKEMGQQPSCEGEGEKKRNDIPGVEARYRAIFERSPDGILIIDAEGKVVEFNETAHRRLGYTREEFAKLRISDIDPFQSPEEIRATISEVLRRGSAEFEVRHRAKGGEIQDVLVITKTMELAGRTVFQTLWHDITDRKRAEAELRRYRERLEELVRERTGDLTRVNEELQRDIAVRRSAEEKVKDSEERFRLISETSMDAIFQIDLRGVITYCSPAVEQFGYAPGEIIGNHFITYVLPSEAQKAKEAFQAAVFGQSVKQLALQMMGKDGTSRHCEINVTPVIKNGQVAGIQGIARDVSERKKAEQALIESETRYRMLFESAGDGIFILDAEDGKKGQIVDANRSAAKMHGYTVEELVGLNIADLDTPDVAERIPERIERMLTGEWITAELTHRRKDGTVFPVEIDGGLLELGNHKYILAFDRNITERRSAEQEREKLILELQDALDKIKTLRGLIPMCAWCKKIRDDKGYWKRVEVYIKEHSDASFTHGICPDCMKIISPEAYEERFKNDDAAKT